MESSLNFFPATKYSAKTMPKFYDVPAKVVLNSEYYSGAKDTSVKMAASWSKKYLYLYFEVEDDNFKQPFHGWKTWAGDSIQLGLAKERNVKSTANAYADDVARALSEMTIALTETGSEVYRTITWDDPRFPAGDAPDGDKGLVSLKDMPTEISLEKLDDGRTLIHYKTAIPWRFVNISNPKVGSIVYFAATVNDSDEGDAAQSRLGIFELKKRMPRQFGAMVLGE